MMHFVLKRTFWMVQCLSASSLPLRFFSPSSLQCTHTIHYLGLKLPKLWINIQHFTILVVSYIVKSAIWSRPPSSSQSVCGNPVFAIYNLHRASYRRTTAICICVFSITACNQPRAMCVLSRLWGISGSFGCEKISGCCPISGSTLPVTTSL